MNSTTGRLDKETHMRIFVEEILPESKIHSTTPQAKPRAIILAGQPGAEKGGLVKASEKELHENVVTIDPDEKRDYYPDVEKLRQTNPYTWSELTNSDSGAWAVELRDVAIEGKRNIIIDTTLGNANTANRLIHELQSEGYEVEIRALAAHCLESELGVDERFLTGVEKKGYGRYVPKDVRDSVYSVLPENLNKIHANTPKITIRVYNREGQALYDSRVDSEAPGHALTRIRQDRVATPKIIRALSEGWNDQLAKHQNLPETLAHNEKVSPATAQAVLDERERANTVLEIEGNVRQINMLDEAVRIRPQQLAVKGLGVAGVVATAADAASTAHDAARLHAQGNDFGAQSKVLSFGGRTVGMLGGAALGAEVGAALGVETGPGMFVTGAIGGVAGAVGGNYIIDEVTRQRIYNQQGSDGNKWHMNPQHPEQGWTRQVGTELTLSALSKAQEIMIS